MYATEEKGEFLKGCRHFDAGEYYEAHDVWEALWMEASGQRHAFLQGMIQTAVGLYHAKCANLRGSEKLLATAIGYLKEGKEVAESVDVESLVEGILDFEIALRREMEGTQGEGSFPYFKIPFRK